MRELCKRLVYIARDVGSTHVQYSITYFCIGDFTEVITLAWTSLFHSADPNYLLSATQAGIPLWPIYTKYSGGPA